MVGLVLSVDVWDSDWPVETKRAVIKAAVDVHRKKGGVEAVKTAVDSVFTGADLLEYPNDPSLAPHQFKIRVSSLGDGDESTVSRLGQLVRAAKPARSHFTAIQVVSTIDSDLHVGAAVHQANILTIKPAQTQYAVIPARYMYQGDWGVPGQRDYYHSGD